MYDQSAEDSVLELIFQAAQADKADDAMKYAQAALNAAQALNSYKMAVPNAKATEQQKD